MRLQALLWGKLRDRSLMFIEAIFITPAAGRPMQRVREVWAVAGCGLEGDRYALKTGYYSGKDECEVTLIEGEAIDRMEAIDGIEIRNGEHRRNLVTRGVALRELHGKRLQIGDVVLEYERPRPPCNYVERLTESGMTRALGKGAGIGVRVLVAGMIREGAEILIAAAPGARPLRSLP
jgi:MOSC domain-containing protein YiiM